MTINLIHRPIPRAFVLAVALLAPDSPAAAQTPPVDLTQLSLRELLELDLAEPDPDQRRRWHVTYRYSRAYFDGYRDGTERVPVDRVLFTPGEPRTDENFPVVPTTIVQDAHVVGIDYRADPGIIVHVTVPIVRQSTRHVSSVPGYALFDIGTAGLGDIGVGVSRVAYTRPGVLWSWSAGATLPTGSIDEVGDTPRAPGDQQLPYTMQLGSGTFDLELGTALKVTTDDPTGLASRLFWELDVLSRIRTGENDRGYRLGHRLALGGLVTADVSRWLRPMVGLSATVTGRIQGLDEELMMAGRFRFPAPVTNPDLFGGRKLNLRFGTEVLLGRSADRRDLRLQILGGRCVYAALNGPQPEEDWRLDVGWAVSF